MKMKINVTSFENQYDNFAENRIVTTWDHLCEFFREHEVVKNKTDVPMFVYGKFEGTEYDVDDVGNIYLRRCAENFKGLEILCLDYDRNFKIIDAVKKFQDYTFLLYTTFSHRTEAKNGHHAFRVLIPFTKPMPVEDMRSRKQSVFDWAGDVDMSTLDCSRGFYIPSCSEENKRKAKVIVNEGKLLDWEQFDKKEIIYEFTPCEHTPEERREIIDQLKQIYVGEEPIWWRVCCAMKAGGFTFEEFCEVTIGGLMKEKDIQDCERKWNRTSMPQFNMGYLINLIRNRGEADFRKPKPTKRLEKEIDTIAKKMLEIKGEMSNERRNKNKTV